MELKARYEDPGKARAILAGSEFVGAFRQTDTYFSLGDRRLKLREFEGSGQTAAQLIYYERPDTAEVKESEVLLYEVSEPEALTDILTRVLGVQVVVRKRREIYRHQGVQVHLDEVDGLGRYVEFELAVEDTPEGVEAGRARLDVLQGLLDVPEEDLVASSYSDLLAD